MKDSTSQQDRREYFRIKNWIIINHEVIDSIDDVPDFGDLKQSNSPRITLLQELTRLENENIGYLSALHEKQSQLGSYLLNLNKKMELLTRFVIQSLDTQKHDLTEVDISGGGLRFSINSRVKIDQFIKVELVLIPECIGIIGYGRVVDCKEIEENRFEIALIFAKLKETDRDAIIKHVFRLQSEQLRSHKDNPTQN